MTLEPHICTADDEFFAPRNFRKSGHLSPRLHVGELRHAGERASRAEPYGGITPAAGRPVMLVSSLDPFLHWWLIDCSAQFVVAGFLEVVDLGWETANER
jgi:hypothetical protein